MKNYEVTFIVDPVLSGDEIKATAQTYVDQIKGEGFEIIHVDDMGLRTLAYPINRRNSGVYFTVEFQGPNGELIDKLELALRRDERIMRFLCIKLDKFGVKYNEDKRKGLIGKVKKKQDKKGRGNNAPAKGKGGPNSGPRRGPAPAPKRPATPAPAEKEAVVAEKEAPTATKEAPATPKEAPAAKEAPAPEVAVTTPKEAPAAKAAAAEEEE